MARKIPNYITDESVRKYLAELNDNISTLKKWHKVLINKAKEKTITKEEAELLQKVIKAHNNLNSQFDQLTPSILQIALKALNKN